MESGVMAGYLYTIAVDSTFSRHPEAYDK